MKWAKITSADWFGSAFKGISPRRSQPSGQWNSSTDRRKNDCTLSTENAAGVRSAALGDDRPVAHLSRAQIRGKDWRGLVNRGQLQGGERTLVWPNAFRTQQGVRTRAGRRGGTRSGEVSPAAEISVPP